MKTIEGKGTFGEFPIKEFLVNLGEEIFEIIRGKN